jgi:hypothetical protein
MTTKENGKLTPNKHRLQEYIKSQQEDYESDILEKRQSRRNIMSMTTKENGNALIIAAL